VAYNIRLTDVKSRCDYSKRTEKFEADIRVHFKATRAPGGEEAHYRVPYYVAVTSGGEIVDKKIHWLEFEFPKSAPSVMVEDWVGDIEVNVARQKRSYEYHLLVGFQLTQAQIDYNKQVGQYLP
jgi:hypothetical protein